MTSPAPSRSLVEGLAIFQDLLANAFDRENFAVLQGRALAPERQSRVYLTTDHSDSLLDTMASPTQYCNSFLGVPPNSVLDPKRSNFSAKAWLSNLVGYASKGSIQLPYRRAGVSFNNLSAYGFGSATDYQKTVGNVWLSALGLVRLGSGDYRERVEILRNFSGLVESGETLLVLGRPGSGCSTFLKAISGDTYGFFIGADSKINYQGIPPNQMHGQFRGEALYTSETDVHFQHLTVGQTLLFAAKARAPRDGVFPGVTRDMYAEHMKNVMMATFGLSHTENTQVGGILVKGVSGGERKRVTLAEAALSCSPLQCWDNCTRGLDSASALNFCETVKLQADLVWSTALVSLYQCSQDAYELFDKVTVLYEGRQIFFGPSHDARKFFENMGFECANRQSTADFLTSLTNPAERRIRSGWENRTPRTADEFSDAWQKSDEYRSLLKDIEAYDLKYPLGGNSVSEFIVSRRAQQAVHQSPRSPYTLSMYQQIMLCVDRGFDRLKGDASITISRVVANTILALVVGSMFYNLSYTTTSFYSRSVLIFLAVLLNAFASALEILTIYEQRPIVEKHSRYALYHPFCEAVASSLCDVPFKICNSIGFNMVLYFMANLRREPSAFFVFLLFSFTVTLALSMVFRTVGASSRTLFQALPFSALFILALMTYTGYVVPIPNMHPWFRWINYINPIAYAFESLIINEFAGRYFDCSLHVPTGPDYTHVSSQNTVCAALGSVPGSNFVSGTEYIKLAFNYEPAHLWRNFCFILVIFAFFTVSYLLATEFVTGKKSKGEILFFQRGHHPPPRPRDVETHVTNEILIREDSHQDSSNTENSIRISNRSIKPQAMTFQWRDICFDIKTENESRRILHSVDGWVKPGTLTALMGPSGAGKTSLLDVLATRETIGTVSGEALVGGKPRDVSFQRKTGYAQQQDIHLQTMTVREALQFNAILCQSSEESREKKLEYVEEVIELLGMTNYADAIVGIAGEGLNVEQRKILTIGVELAAKPDLLLFLDEPTSGLDSQTSWAVLSVLEKLKAHSQAILCTIHQPSATLFERFDRLLLLGPEGKPTYFGEIGPEAITVIEYFERNGAKPCPSESNPAEWMMGLIADQSSSRSSIDWPAVWRQSPEYAEVHQQLEDLKMKGLLELAVNLSTADADEKEFAAPFSVQLWECFKRVSQQYWRDPVYIYSKAGLSLGAGLFLGFSFYMTDNSLQGLQSQAFSIFMLLSQASNFVPQIFPNFVLQRAIYEARERPAKTYSWKAFILSCILVEIPWNTLMAILTFVAWYYPIGFYRYATETNTVVERGFTMFLFMWVYMLFMSTVGHMVQAGIDLAEIGGNYVNLLLMMALIFCGVLISPNELPRFWVFMYRVSPFTYLVSGILSVGLANAAIKCSSIELLHFDPVIGETCGTYMKSYMEMAGGYLTNSDDVENCSYCPFSNTNQFLKMVNASYDERWRDWGILWVFVGVNVLGALFFYWLVRVPKGRKKGGVVR